MELITSAAVATDDCADGMCALPPAAPDLYAATDDCADGMCALPPAAYAAEASFHSR